MSNRKAARKVARKAITALKRRKAATSETSRKYAENVERAALNELLLIAAKMYVTRLVETHKVTEQAAVRMAVRTFELLPVKVDADAPNRLDSIDQNGR
jgi:hypothetical protein